MSKQRCFGYLELHPTLGVSWLDAQNDLWRNHRNGEATGGVSRRPCARQTAVSSAVSGFCLSQTRQLSAYVSQFLCKLQDVKGAQREFNVQRGGSLLPSLREPEKKKAGSQGEIVKQYAVIPAYPYVSKPTELPKQRIPCRWRAAAPPRSLKQTQNRAPSYSAQFKHQSSQGGCKTHKSVKPKLNVQTALLWLSGATPYFGGELA